MGTILDGPVRQFLDDAPVGTLATLRADGKPRHTLVCFVRDGARILLSTEGKRGKARDVERTGWASFCVMGHEKPFPSLTVEGPARVLREGIGEATARVMQKITGNTPDTPPTDEQLAAGDRVILEIGIERIYGISYVA
jgi:PPOX class probable F420-dependent enzyme